MPLYNVMARGMRLPRIGTIRKGMQVPVIDKATGEPKKNKDGETVMRPEEKPWFVFHVDPTEQESVFAKLREAYGTDQINSLNVFLALPDANSNFSSWMEAYTANQMVARADERVVIYLFDTWSNEILIKDGVVTAHSSVANSPAGLLVANTPIGSPLPYRPDMIVAQAKGSDKAITFKAVGRLNVVIKELRRLITFTVITGGYWYDIPAIYSCVEILDAIAQATGRGANTIPLTLRRVPRERSFTNEKGEKVKRIYHDIELEIRADVTAGLLASYEDAPFTFALANPNHGLPTLPANVRESSEDYSDPVSEPMEAEPVKEAPLPPGPQTDDTRDEMIDPLATLAVQWAARQWNITIPQARDAIRAKTDQDGQNLFFSPMSKRLFKSIVTQGKK